MENTVYGQAHSLYGLLMALALFALTLALGIPFFGSIVAHHRLRVEVELESG